MKNAENSPELYSVCSVMCIANVLSGIEMKPSDDIST